MVLSTCASRHGEIKHSKQPRCGRCLGTNSGVPRNTDGDSPLPPSFPLPISAHRSRSFLDSRVAACTDRDCETRFSRRRRRRRRFHLSRWIGSPYLRGLVTSARAQETRPEKKEKEGQDKRKSDRQIERERESNRRRFVPIREMNRRRCPENLARGHGRRRAHSRAGSNTLIVYITEAMTITMTMTTPSSQLTTTTMTMAAVRSEFSRVTDSSIATRDSDRSLRDWYRETNAQWLSTIIRASAKARSLRGSRYLRDATHRGKKGISRRPLLRRSHGPNQPHRPISVRGLLPAPISRYVNSHSRTRRSGNLRGRADDDAQLWQLRALPRVLWSRKKAVPLFIPTAARRWISPPSANSKRAVRLLRLPANLFTSE